MRARPRCSPPSISTCPLASARCVAVLREQRVHRHPVLKRLSEESAWFALLKGPHPTCAERAPYRHGSHPCRQPRNEGPVLRECPRRRELVQSEPSQNRRGCGSRVFLRREVSPGSLTL